jgi:hypothetical protein
LDQFPVEKNNVIFENIKRSNMAKLNAEMFVPTINIKTIQKTKKTVPTVVKQRTLV